MFVIFVYSYIKKFKGLQFNFLYIYKGKTRHLHLISLINNTVACPCWHPHMLVLLFRTIFTLLLITPTSRAKMTKGKMHVQIHHLNSVTPPRKNAKPAINLI